MSVAFSDSATGWSGSYLTDTGGTRPPAGGLVLQEVRNAGSNFARDLRTIGIRIKVEEVAPGGAVSPVGSVFVPLSDPPFTVGSISVLTPATVTIPAVTPATGVRFLREAYEVPQFNTYFRDGVNYVAYGLRVDYTLPASWFSGQWSNCETSGLEVSQRFLFSRYASDPRHEPSGNLMAARFHPIIRFSLTDNPSVDRTRAYQRIASVRFDYRLALQLDRHEDPAVNRTMPQLGQNAGLFKDEEVSAGPLPLFAPSQVFAALEKPLVLEVWAYGLWEGVPSVGPRGTYGATSAPRGWDNVHWWGAKGLGVPSISTPGAAHAAHVHWRWGGVGSSVRATYPEIDGSGVPSGVASRRWSGNATRVLVDPQAWIQTLRVAVTLNEPSLDPAGSGVTLESLAKDDWPTLFTGLRSTPRDIYAGADIVLWYSTEVHARTYFPAEYSMAIFPTLLQAGMTYTSGKSGSVFIHGIFFAHNAETGGLQAGSRDPIHRPRSLADIRAHPAWNRNAR
jgi:hypothetical protein